MYIVHRMLWVRMIKGIEMTAFDTEYVQFVENLDNVL